MNGASLIGSKLGKYQVQEEIGRGGMGAVFKGYDPALDRYVAIKVLAPHLVWEPDFVERFLREARSAARLQHPHIVTIYDVGQEGGWYYYVMEYLEGQTLTELIEEHHPLPFDTALAILRPMADALDHAHHNGLVHRDIKPGNIIVGRAGRVSLTDFGIARAAQEARLTATGTTVGTPEYMSPEQVKGLAVDARSDQYSLAVVAYEMLSGQVPFKAESTLALMYRIVHEPPPPLRQVRGDVPVPVEEVLAKALAKDPGDRYPTVGAFVEGLARALAGQKSKVKAAKAITPPVPPPTSRRERGLTPAEAAPVQRVTPSGQRGGLAPTAISAAAAPAAEPCAAPRRHFPLWLLALAGLTIVVLGVALALALSGGGRKATSTPALSMITQIVTDTPATLPTRVVTNTPLATQTLAASLSTAPTSAPSATPAPVRTESPTPPPPAPSEPPTVPPPTATSPPTLIAAPSATTPPTAAPTATRPAATRAPTRPAGQFAAPNLLEPADGRSFAQGEVIVLRWQSVGTLPEDAFYRIKVDFTPAQDPAMTWGWTDYSWVKEAQWALSQHDYLPTLSADGVFRWSVQVMRRTGSDDAKGEPLGAASATRTLNWSASPQSGGGGGGGGGGQPTRPPSTPEG